MKKFISINKFNFLDIVKLYKHYYDSDSEGFISILKKFPFFGDEKSAEQKDYSSKDDNPSEWIEIMDEVIANKKSQLNFFSVIMSVSQKILFSNA